MTAKRFEINNDMNLDGDVETYELSCIVDTDNKTFYFVVDSIANVESFVGRLNELHEEKSLLLRKNGAMEEEIECLSEENQSLKKKLEFFNELNKPYGTIIEENKRLKSFINRLTNDCGEILLMNGMRYNVKKIFGDLE